MTSSKGCFYCWTELHDVETFQDAESVSALYKVSQTVGFMFTDSVYCVVLFERYVALQAKDYRNGIQISKTPK